MFWRPFTHTTCLLLSRVFATSTLGCGPERDSCSKAPLCYLDSGSATQRQWFTKSFLWICCFVLSFVSPNGLCE